MQWISEVLSGYMAAYYIRQVLCELLLYILGTVIVVSTMVSGVDKNEAVYSKLRIAVSLGGIVGLAAFITAGYCVLAAGIPYNAFVMNVLMAVVFAVFIVIGIKRKSFTTVIKNIKPFYCVIWIAVCVVAALIATSGYMRISISNDSLYYFWQYPRAIVRYSGLRDQFDNFLTDTGLGAAVVGTLPFLYGFGQTFGIQEFFHMGFALFFGNAMYESIAFIKPTCSKKRAAVISILAMLLLVFCTPVYIISHWAMANMYFMEFFFAALFLFVYMNIRSEQSAWATAMLLMFACSATRMEGGIFVLFLVVSVSVLENNSVALAGSIIPIAILNGLYEVKVFLSYNIDNPYLFMTPLKAVVQFVAYIAVIIYVLYIDKLLPLAVKKHVKIAFIVALIAVNGLLFVADTGRYIENLRAFAGNLFGQSGWGIVPYVLIGTIAVCVALMLTGRTGRKMGLLRNNNPIVSFWIFCAIGFLLVAFAVSFARGDALNITTGDSGNRVLLQIVPVLLFAVILGTVNCIFTSEED